MRFKNIIILLLMIGVSFSATIAKQMDFLASGVQNNQSKPNANGKVYFYSSSQRSTAKTVWSDANKTTPLSQPVNLNIRGQATVFGDGTYYITVKDSTSKTLSTFDYFNYQYIPSQNLTGYIDILTTYGNNTVALQDAITAAGSTPTSLLFLPSSYVVSGPLTFPSNITLKFMQGAYLNISLGNNVYINGPIEAGGYAIKQGAGNLYVASTPNEIQFSIWGASPSPDWSIDFKGNITVSPGNYYGGPNITLTNLISSLNLIIQASDNVNIDSTTSPLNLNGLTNQPVYIGQGGGSVYINSLQATMNGNINISATGNITITGSITATTLDASFSNIASASITTLNLDKMSIITNNLTVSSGDFIVSVPSGNRIKLDRTFGAWVTYDYAFDTVMYATTDIFVCGIGEGANSGAFLVGYTDSKITPDTIVGVELCGVSGVGSGGSISFPVRKGDRFKFSNAVASITTFKLSIMSFGI